MLSRKLNSHLKRSLSAEFLGCEWLQEEVASKDYAAATAAVARLSNEAIYGTFSRLWSVWYAGKYFARQMFGV